MPTVAPSPIGREDVEGILAVEAAAFATPWGRRSILGELAAADNVQFAARAPSQAGGAWSALFLPASWATKCT